MVSKAEIPPIQIEDASRPKALLDAQVYFYSMFDFFLKKKIIK